MKNPFKIFGLFVLSISLHACSSEDETLKPTALDQELLAANEGVLTIGSATYIFKESGETSKFEGEHKKFDFDFADELIFKIDEAHFKHADAFLLIENPATEEFIKVDHFEQINKNTISFNVELSTGDKYYSVVYRTNKDAASNKWHDGPGFSLEPTVIEAFIEPSQTSSCNVNVAACENSGGRATLGLSHAQGWFTPSQSCKVQCI